ncbi:MAG TPA: methyltransferase domain-containing protein [Burkholderiales bacterium]
MHAPLELASDWVRRWAPLVTRGPVLDVACGGGRHARLFLRKRVPVVAVDREPQAIPGAEFVQADLEAGPWPFPGRRFAAVVVTNYLHRPLLPRLQASLEEGGVLIYETFMVGNERFGRPSNPAFLLRPGELLAAFAELEPLAFEQGRVERPRPAVVQRLCARKGPAGEVRIDAPIEEAAP